MNQFRLILLVPVIKKLRNKVRDGSEPTKIGYKIPQNGQKLLKFCKWSIIKLNFVYQVQKYLFIIYNCPYWGRGPFLCYSISLKNRPKRPTFSGKIKFTVLKTILSLILNLTPILPLKCVLQFFQISHFVNEMPSDFKCSSVCRANRIFRQHF